jgi:hypothetical protein
MTVDVLPDAHLKHGGRLFFGGNMELQSAWTFFIDSVFPHWPGVFFALFISIIAQVLKKNVLTKDMAAKSKVVFWSRRLFPIGLLFLGLIPGLTWPGEILPGIDSTVEKVWYFIGCAGCSILGYNVLKQWVRKKYDVDISSYDGE